MLYLRLEAISHTQPFRPIQKGAVWLPFVLVEVAGLELAASSTRNWRATTCATPRNCDIIAQFLLFVKGISEKIPLEEDDGGDSIAPILNAPASGSRR